MASCRISSLDCSRQGNQLALLGLTSFRSCRFSTARNNSSCAFRLAPYATSNRICLASVVGVQTTSPSSATAVWSAAVNGRSTNITLRKNSDALWASSTNDNHGYQRLNAMVRSVLCHPIGLPLVAAFHGKKSSQNRFHTRWMRFQKRSGRTMTQEIIFYLNLTPKE